MGIITTFIVVIFLAVILIPFVSVKGKGIITVTTVTAIAIFTSIYFRVR